VVFKIKLVILDYDLTLVNNIIDFYISFSEALEKFTGKTLTFNEFYNYLARDELINILPDSIDQWVFWREMRRRICSSHTLIPSRGVKEFLYTTSFFNIKNVIVSGKECHPKYLELELEKIGIRDYVDGIYTFYSLQILNGVEETLFDKSWLLKYVVNKYKVDPLETVYIGDYKMDYYSSLKAGVNFIGLASLPSRAKMFKEIGTKYVARDFYEALYLLLRIKR